METRCDLDKHLYLMVTIERSADANEALYWRIVVTLDRNRISTAICFIALHRLRMASNLDLPDSVIP